MILGLLMQLALVLPALGQIQEQATVELQPETPEQAPASTPGERTGTPVEMDEADAHAAGVTRGGARAAGLVAFTSAALWAASSETLAGFALMVFGLAACSCMGLLGLVHMTEPLIKDWIDVLALATVTAATGACVTAVCLPVPTVLAVAVAQVVTGALAVWLGLSRRSGLAVAGTFLLAIAPALVLWSLGATLGALAVPASLLVLFGTPNVLLWPGTSLTDRWAPGVLVMGGVLVLGAVGVAPVLGALLGQGLSLAGLVAVAGLSDVMD